MMLTLITVTLPPPRLLRHMLPLRRFSTPIDVAIFAALMPLFRSAAASPLLMPL